MHQLRELVYGTTLHSDYATTFASLLSKLTELHIEVAKEDRDRGEIVARCLTSLINVALWRCWSDKLVFEIRPVEAAKTQVEIYAVPNLFRFRTSKNEEAIEVKKLISQLFI